VHEVEYGGDGSVGQCLRGKRLHAALHNPPRFTQPIHKDTQLPLRAEAARQPLFALHHVLRAGVALLRQQSCEHTTLCGHGVDGVLHHGELTCSNGTQCAVAAGRDADGVLNLFPAEVESAAGDDGRDEGCQGGVVPAALADAGEGCLAEAHLEFMSQHQAHDQLSTVAAGALRAGYGGGEDIGRMGRILFPINVVVIHHPDHKGVGERGRDRVHLPALPDHDGGARPGELV